MIRSINQNNLFTDLSPHASHAIEEEMQEEVFEFVAEGNLEHLESHEPKHEPSSEHHKLNFFCRTNLKDTPAEGTDLTRLQETDESLLSLGANTFGFAVGAINVDEGIEGLKLAAKQDDSSGFVNSFFRTFKGFFESIEKSLSTSKNFFESTQMMSLGSASSVIVNSTILGGAAGASLGLLAITSLSAKEKYSFSKKYQDILSQGAKDPKSYNTALRALADSLDISSEEKIALCHQLMRPASLLGAIKKTVREFLDKDPQAALLENALQNPQQFDLKALSASLPKGSKDALDPIIKNVELPTAFSTLDKDSQECFLHILGHVFSKAVNHHLEAKASTFKRIFGDEVAEGVVKFQKSQPLDDVEKKTIITKASSNLAKETQRSFIKLLGALMVAAITILTQISTQGAFYLAETALCLVVTACSLVCEIYSVIKCIQSQKMSFKQKVIAILKSVCMIFLVSASAVILRVTLSPIATGILTISWLLLTCYIFGLWISKKHAHNHHEKEPSIKP